MNFSWPQPGACGSAAVLSNMKSDAYATIAACSIGSSGSVPTAQPEILVGRARFGARPSGRADEAHLDRLLLAPLRRAAVELLGTAPLRARGGRTSSGSGTSGMGSLCSGPSSTTWNDVAMLKIARPCWIATTRRVTKLRPSRMRSTSKTIGVSGSPGRRKYAWSESARESPCRPFDRRRRAPARAPARRRHAFVPLRGSRRGTGSLRGVRGRACRRDRPGRFPRPRKPTGPLLPESRTANSATRGDEPSAASELLARSERLRAGYPGSQ